MTLRLAALALAVLAAVLAVPAPRWLAWARWPRRDPRLGLLAWQAIGLAGGMAILTAELTLAAADVAPRWRSGVTGLPAHHDRLGPVGWAALVALAVTLLWLLSVLARSTVRVLVARRQHRLRLDLLAARGHGGLRVLDHPAATAYCVPGLRPRVVLSSGALATLGEAEVDAVLAHERAHLRARHDLVLQPFVAWRETFPFLPSATLALASVEALVERHADRIAARACGPAPVAAALRALRPAVSTGGLRETADLPRRISQLTSPARGLPGPVALLVVVASVLLVAAPPLLLLAL